VVRTRVMLTDIRHWQQAARAHAERFAQIRPAATFIEVPRFVDPQWLVEFEVDAIIAASGPTCQTSPRWLGRQRRKRVRYQEGSTTTLSSLY
jgi:hypothetical protein